MLILWTYTRSMRPRAAQGSIYERRPRSLTCGSLAGVGLGLVTALAFATLLLAHLAFEAGALKTIQGGGQRARRLGDVSKGSYPYMVPTSPLP
jgi:hypothetical protein